MKRATLYSRSTRSPPRSPSSSLSPSPTPNRNQTQPIRTEKSDSTPVNGVARHATHTKDTHNTNHANIDRTVGSNSGDPSINSRWQTFVKKPWVVLSFGVLVGAAIVFQLTPASVHAPALNQSQVESIVLETLATQSLPARAAQVAAVVAPSVVSIQSIDTEASERPPSNQISERGKGTGFVIKDDGTILTNHHIVADAKRIMVTFADGMTSPAIIISAQPERDLAVLQPARIPEDLLAVTLAAGGQLTPGDLVVAVGFPFGLGLSVSAGIVSGLDRTFPIPGGRPLEGLIQFDAAVNPGNSGGPLINQNGEVVGVVTALFNPSSDGTFAGIGFAITMESAANSVGIPPF
jgi:S1-C subfamily serine protease